MKKTRIYTFLLCLLLCLTCPTPLTMEAQAVVTYELPMGCGAPIPSSAPGEEKNDLISAIGAFSILLIIVGGGIIYLEKKNQKKEQE